MNNFGVPWKPEDVERLKAMALAGAPYKKIAKELGRKERAISAKLNKLGIWQGYAKRSAALALLAAGVPYMEVHRETGVSMSSLNRIKKEIA